MKHFYEGGNAMPNLKQKRTFLILINLKTYLYSFKCLLLSLSTYCYQFSCNIQESRASGTTGYSRERGNSVIKERLRRRFASRSDGGKGNDGRISRVGLLTIFCVLFSSLAFTQAAAQTQAELVLRGEVRSAADGQAIEGASIIVDKKHARTDKEGRFTISVNKPTGTLTVKHIGYNEQKIAYENTATLLKILLETSSKQIEEVEVVSTGFQKIPKERATGSFEFIDSALFNRKVSTDFVSRLEDVVPGISSVKYNPNNRGYSMGVQIRGASTLRSEQAPLVVIDGVPYDHRAGEYGLGTYYNINPNDIENITILKDAAAASIWGTQSGNGVIVITTKRAQFNSSAKLSFNSNISVKERPNLYYHKQMNAEDYIDLQQFLFDKGVYDRWFTNKFRNPQPVLWLMNDRKNNIISQQEFESKIGELKQNDVRDDFTKFIYRKAVNKQANLQLTAGGDKTSTIFSLGYDKNLNDIVTSSYDRLTLKSNSQIKPVKNLLLDIGITYTVSKNEQNAFSVGYNGLQVTKTNYPYLRLVDQKGNPSSLDLSGYNPLFRDTLANGRLLDWSFSPLKELNKSKETQSLKEFFGNFQASYAFDFGMKVNLLYAHKRTTLPIEQWIGMETFQRRDELNMYASWDNDAVTWNLPFGDYLNTLNWDINAHQGRASFDYARKWSDKHHLSLLAGFEIAKNQKLLTTVQYQGFDRETGAFKPAPYGVNLPFLNGLQGTRTLIDRSRYENLQNNFVSYFVNGSYTYSDRYIFSGSLRKDASNLFGVKSNDRGQPFWSLGGAWLISNEAFLSSLPIDFLKLRATYGYNGNVNNTVAAYPILYRETQPHYINNQNYGMIFTPPNPALRWERVGIINLGVDFNILKNRVNGSIEYFEKNAKDLIAPDKIDPTTGFTNLMINTANIKTKGWDISLNGNLLHYKNWKWMSNLMFSYARTKVLKSYVSNDNGQDFIAAQQSVLTTPIEGMDLNAILTYRWAGLDPENGDAQAYFDGEVSKDYYAITAMNVKDLEYHGSAIPLYFGSWRNSIKYNVVELSWNIAYQLGHKFIRNSFDNQLFVNNDIGHSDYALRWQKTGDELKTDVPAFSYPANLGSQVYMRSSALVENGGQIKLRDIQLSVQLPFTERYKLKNCRVYGYIQNVGTIWRANKWGIDSEYGFGLPDPLMTSLGFSFNF